MTKAISFVDDKIKPRLLESRLLERTDFMRLSDGFKKAFTDDMRVNLRCLNAH